ncbi:MAG: MFS transporter [Novosphingobium sp.]|nr:MFS transporter [Novosphingobium sp.]MCP5400778.1 MFS transporter [Novosphingobium sp.]
MRFYYGWVIVAIGLILLMIPVGLMNAFGLFVIPVSEAFNLSRANMNTGIILLHLGTAAAAPFVGRMLDVYSARKILIAGAILFSLSMIVLGLSTNIWLSAFVIAVPLALGIAGGSTLTAPALVTRWFSANRGRAMAITMMGMSLGSVVIVPLFGVLIDTFGWRQCLVIVGCGLAVIFLAIVPLARERPGPDDREPMTAGEAEKQAVARDSQAGQSPLKTSQLLRTPHFWTMALSTAMALGALQTIIISLVPLAQENGLSVNQSASLVSLVGALAFAGKLMLAWLGERVDRVLLLSGVFVLVMLTSVALLFDHSYVALLGCSVLIGLASGTVTPAFLALLADRFGAASFGTANGTATLVMAITSATSIRLGGEIYDRTGNYDAMFLTFGALALISALLMITNRPRKRLGGSAQPT